ncbi:MAG: Nif3-like dinuclear metal center hexameric protein [Clostridia bacterium]|nr:Nif3-like dinuclear metal center hexameric protein [Clostridia bacterium]
MTLPAKEIYAALEREFRPWECTEVFSTMGLQFDNTDVVNKVYTAAFVSHEVMDQIESRGDTHCLLFTHHPVPQKKDLTKDSPPPDDRLVERLRQSCISVFNYHIPLDRVSPWSPGTNLAKAMGLTPYEEFYEQNLVKMGLLCRTPFATQTEFARAAEQVLGHRVKLYAYGEDALPGGRIALMGGGASNPDIYAELRDKGINLFFTGMSAPHIPFCARNHAAAKAAGVSILGGTHYSTEKYAVMEMVKFFRGLGLDSEFLPETPNFEEL